MKIMYEATTEGTVTKVKVNKETYCFVYLEGRPGRWAKRSDYYNYFDSFEQAKNFIKKRYLQKCKEAQIRLRSYQTKLEELDLLQEEAIKEG